MNTQQFSIPVKRNRSADEIKKAAIKQIMHGRSYRITYCAADTLWHKTKLVAIFYSIIVYDHFQVKFTRFKEALHQFKDYE